MIKNAYIHIPFCRRKCNYCTFVSYDTLTLKNVYIDSLLEEIKTNYKGEKLNTIYFGGGTPSILSTSDFGLILSELNFDKNTEITVEINPETVDREYLDNLKAQNINRLSIGTQVFDNNILQLIGRNHTKETAIKTVQNAQNAGFSNISIDLIYGLPTQNTENFLTSLKIATDLNIQHISLYGLKIEEGCAFFNHKPHFLPENDDQAEMYIEAIDYLEKSGFFQYEISNFSKPNFESKHNLNYWNNGLYYGFGVAASGYEDDIRYTNVSTIEEYIKLPNKKIYIEKVTPQHELEEEIFLGLRETKGLNIPNINKKFGIDFDKKYSEIIKKYSETNHIKKTQYGYALTRQGILLSNNILSEFIEI
ncbi:MAG: radical SAM family heme chaperone HemW [Candidatus Gastranaerophilales bacterium]|nr:radical SAM family heme chaperone HemW [Candidatus Gastranaerophilales bacterium]